MAPTRPDRMATSRIRSLTSPPIVSATLVFRNAPTRLSPAERSTAMRGDNACVETEVAMAFAVSWKPFV